MYSPRRQGSGSQNGGPKSCNKHLRTPEQIAQDKKRACPICCSLVAPGDPSKIIIENVHYHRECMGQEN